jgi:hypothetical protein
MEKAGRLRVCLVIAACAAACQRPHGGAALPSPIERGRYLVTVAGCNDCHTPWKLGEKGPEPDMSRMLSGHPEGMKLPPPPALPPGPWGFTGTLTMTAWSGPWGTSYAANLTPDPETGLGALSEANFTVAMRTGRHFGGGRAILPPMPWVWVGKMSDDDLKAIWAYLQAIPPIRNRVPDPVPPARAD